MRKEKMKGKRPRGERLEEALKKIKEELMRAGLRERMGREERWYRCVEVAKEKGKNVKVNDEDVEMEDVEMSDVLTTVEEYLADDLVTFLLLNNPTVQDPEAFLNGILEFLQYMQDLNMLNLGAGFAKEIIRGTAAVISADDQRFGDDDGDGLVNGLDADYKGSPWTTDDHGSYAARLVNWLLSSDDDDEEDFGLSICEIAPDLCGGSYSPDVLTFFDDYGVDQSTFYWAYIDMQTAYTTMDDLYQ